MNEEPPMFQQSLIPQVRTRFSFDRAIGWSAVIVDIALATFYPRWKLGSLIVPVALLLFFNTKPNQTKSDQHQATGVGQ